MKRGYIGEIGNEFVFIVAKNKSDAEIKIKEASEGKPWKMETYRQFKVIEK